MIECCINNLESFNSDYGYIYKTIQKEDKAVSLGFSGGKVDDSLIDQDMFNNYMSSYGKGDPPVRTRAKKVPRRPIK